MALPDTVTAPAPTTLDRLISTREVMARTTLSRSTLWRMVRAGTLPAPIQVTPARIAWRESQLVAWLDARTPAHDDARHIRAGA